MSTDPVTPAVDYSDASQVDVTAVARQIVANGTASVSVGGRTVSFISINDLISWIKFEKQNAAGANPAGCLRFGKMEGGSTRW